jgi:hypothetical protein
MNTLAKVLTTVLLITVAAHSVAFAAVAPQTLEHAAAIRACGQINEFQPVEVVNTVSDGRGNSLVWLNDADGDLWLCNADRNGNVYANDIMAGDMLNGEGLDELLRQNTIDGEELDVLAPQVVAEHICRISAPEQPAQVVSTAPDGMNDYTVFVQGAGNDVYLCNASGNAEIFSFVQIGEPLNTGSSS